MAEAIIRDHFGKESILKSQHIRYLLFWMCEDNFKDWEEERLGIKLKKFFKIFYKSLAIEEFPHYFVESYNMFSVMPQRHLRIMQVSTIGISVKI